MELSTNNIIISGVDVDFTPLSELSVVLELGMSSKSFCKIRRQKRERDRLTSCNC